MDSSSASLAGVVVDVSSYEVIVVDLKDLKFDECFISKLESCYIVKSEIYTNEVNYYGVDLTKMFVDNSVIGVEVSSGGLVSVVINPVDLMIRNKDVREVAEAIDKVVGKKGRVVRGKRSYRIVYEW